MDEKTCGSIPGGLIVTHTQMEPGTPRLVTFTFTLVIDKGLECVNELMNELCLVTSEAVPNLLRARLRSAILRTQMHAVVHTQND